MNYRVLCSSVLALLFYINTVSAQMRWEPQTNVAGVHLRGLCVVNDSVIWASGAGGTWITSGDAGNSWAKGVVPGADSLDFRDIHAVDKDRAWVLSAGAVGSIYYTKDRGKNWQLQYRNTRPGVFFDGFAFWNNSSGMAYSDPINGKLLIIKTENSGKSWYQIDPLLLPSVLDKEAGFAASGTGICVYGDSLVWVATGGGARARIFKSADRGNTWSVYDTPLKSKGGAGIFSMTFKNENYGVIVGGDYVDSTNADSNCAVTQDGGVTWQLQTIKNPRGYRSCVAFVLGDKLISTGRTGSDVSDNFGITWKYFSEAGYYACDCTERLCWAVGRNGKIAYLDFR
ncbi:MAG TPA: oxidoreductase [Flavobacteriales bacterium]|nr:oxidoreductase [Flavobacteriales bacterium]HIO73380.1 oxidoreductase [Flavobacteriales bacterium]